MTAVEALATLLAAEALFLVIVLLVASKKVSVRFRDLEVTARESAQVIRRVDAAVNNTPHGAPTLIERVAALESAQVQHASETRERLARLESRIAGIEDLVRQLRETVGVRGVV